MFGFYYVKHDLPGAPAGTVERFSLNRAAVLVSEGEIVPYDEKKHANKPGSEAVPEGYRAELGKCPTCGK